MTSAIDPIVGSVLGSFRVVKAIGRGGMGSVYLGEHTVIGSRVAIKVLHDRLATDENLVARFYAEARAVNLIGHENIVNIFDMNVVPPNRYYLVMEYLEGKPLNALLTQAVDVEVAVPILLQVCDALSGAHKAGIIHRDLKPENIFLTRRGRVDNFVKVLDFGLAKVLEGNPRAVQQTTAGLIVGTPEFMSPEQANSTPVDGRADIYALGCISWLLATGRLPFPQRGLADLLVAHRQHTPPPPHEVNRDVPKDWSASIMKAMSKKPEDRYQTADEMAAALEEVLARAVPDSAASPAPTVFAPAASPAAPVITAGQPPPPPKGLPPLPTRADVSPPRPPPSRPEPVPRIIEKGRPPPPPPADPRVSTASGTQVAVRHEARFDAVVTVVGGGPIGNLPCRDISRGGMFLCTPGPMPALFSRVKVTIPSAHGLELLGEVVRHVPPEQAKAWNMQPGFGVQFVELTPSLRESVDRVIQGLPLQARPPAPVTADAIAERVIAKFRDRVNGDHYEMLGLAPDADFPEIRTRTREAQRELEALRTRPLTDAQKEQLTAALARVKGASETLAHPVMRVEFDANRGNYKGVARAVAAGLSTADLDRLRNQFLQTHPGVAGSAHVKFLASKGYEATGQIRQALDACESALQLDPLNIQLHARHAALLKKLPGK